MGLLWLWAGIEWGHGISAVGLGNRTGLACPNGRQATHTYNGNGRLQTAQKWDNGTTIYENDTILVCACLDDDNGRNSNSAYPFTYNGRTWNEADKLTAANGQTNDYFGAAVTFNETGQALLVGAYWEDEAAADAGAAYYFTTHTYNRNGRLQTTQN